MSERPQVVGFGHSFPACLTRRCQRIGNSVMELLNLSEDTCDITVRGHSGLTFSRVLLNPERYLREICRNTVHVLVLDLGTNDLCNMDGEADVVVDRAIRFLDLLLARPDGPRHVEFLSVIQRSKITRAGQVSVTTFNRRSRQYNARLGRVISLDYTRAHLYTQRKLNYPKYLIDGCHPNEEGMVKYCRGLREVIIRTKSKVLQTQVEIP